MASSAAEARSKERVRRLCQSVVDARTLRQKVLDEIRLIVPFDAYAWLLTDPETSVGSSPLADAPCLSELPTLIRLKYLTEVNRWTRLGRLSGCCSRRPGRLVPEPGVAELLRRYHVVDVASVRLPRPRSAAGGFSTCGEVTRWDGSRQRMPRTSVASPHR